MTSINEILSWEKVSYQTEPRNVTKTAKKAIERGMFSESVAASIGAYFVSKALLLANDEELNPVPEETVLRYSQSFGTALIHSKHQMPLDPIAAASAVRVYIFKALENNLVTSADGKLHLTSEGFEAANDLARTCVYS